MDSLDIGQTEEIVQLIPFALQPEGGERSVSVLSGTRLREKELAGTRQGEQNGPWTQAEGEEESVGDEDPIVSDLQQLNDLAVAAFREGELEYAETLLKKAFERLKDAKQKSPRLLKEFATTVSNCGTLELRKGNAGNAMESFLLSLSYEEEIGNCIGRASSLINISILFNMRQQHTIAFQRAEHALKILMEDSEVREMAQRRKKKVTSKRKNGTLTSRGNKAMASTVEETKARVLASTYHELASNLDHLGDASGVVIKRELVSHDEARNRAVRLYFMAWDVAEAYLGPVDTLTRQLREDYSTAVKATWRQSDQIPRPLNWRSQARVKARNQIIQKSASARLQTMQQIEGEARLKMLQKRREHDMTEVLEGDWDLFRKGAHDSRRGEIHSIIRNMRRSSQSAPSPVLEYLSDSNENPGVAGALSHRAKGALRLLQANANRTALPEDPPPPPTYRSAGSRSVLGIADEFRPLAGPNITPGPKRILDSERKWAVKYEERDIIRGKKEYNAEYPFEKAESRQMNAPEEAVFFRDFDAYSTSPRGWDLRTRNRQVVKPTSPKAPLLGTLRWTEEGGSILTDARSDPRLRRYIRAQTSQGFWAPSSQEK